MPLNVLPGIPAAGSIKIAWVPGGLTTPAAPKLSEITAVSAVDISCLTMSDGFGNTVDQSVGTGRRICSAIPYDIPGPIRRAFNVLKAVYDPQGATTTALNKAWTGLVPGTTGDFVIRYGLPGTQDFAIGDKVNVISARLGAQNQEAPDDEGELVFTQTIYGTGTENIGKTMVA